MLERAKNLTAHSNANPSYLELFKKLAGIALEKLDPMERAKRSRRFKKTGSSENSERAQKDCFENQSRSEVIENNSQDCFENPREPEIAEVSNAGSAQNLSKSSAGQEKSQPVPKQDDFLNQQNNFKSQALSHSFDFSNQKQKPHSRYNPASVEYEVWIRDAGCCQYIDPKTGKKCGSQFGVETEHRVPFAKGGEHSVENCFLLCKQHNLLAAQQEFGEEFMNKYWKSSY